MSGAHHRLDQLLKKSRRIGRIDSSVCRNILATTRELIEAKNEKEKYSITNLYCNWSLHNEISGSIAAIRALKIVSQRFSLLYSGNDSPEDLLQYVTEKTFQLDAFREEITALFRSHCLNDFMYTIDENWFVFSALTLQDLVGKPLQFPDGADTDPISTDSKLMQKAKRIYQEIFVVCNNINAQVLKKAWITLDIDPWDERLEQHRQPVFHCNVQGFDGPTFKIRITNITPMPEADEYHLLT